MIRSRIESPPAAARSRHSVAVARGSRYIRTLARPGAIVVLANQWLDLGQGPIGVVPPQIAVPQLLEKPDRRLSADLLAAHLSSRVLSVRIGIPQDERGGGQHEELVRGAAVTGQSPLHVGVERLTFAQGGVAAEDGISR